MATGLDRGGCVYGRIRLDRERWIRRLVVGEALAGIAELLWALDIDILLRAVHVQQIKVPFVSGVSEEGNAPLLFEGAFLHVQTHCHVYLKMNTKNNLNISER